MINKLKYTLDYQKFSPNSRLSAMIDDVEQRYTALADDDLFFVAAAGEDARWDEDEDESDGIF